MEGRVVLAPTIYGIICDHVVGEVEEVLASVATSLDVLLAENFKQGPEFAPV